MMRVPDHEHYCDDLDQFPINKFLQKGSDKGKEILIVGESPAPNGWRKSGKACYTSEGKLLPTGERLNELLLPHNMSVEICGFTELAKCHIGKDRHKLLVCARKCWPIFIAQLKVIDPKLIILLGVHTLNIYNKISMQNHLIGKLSSTTVGKRVYKFLPIYHPSPINPHGRVKNQRIFSEYKKVISELII